MATALERTIDTERLFDTLAGILYRLGKAWGRLDVSLSHAAVNRYQNFSSTTILKGDLVLRLIECA